MSTGKSDKIRYSLGFKKQVVDMVEQGHYSKSEIARRYQIGLTSIYAWVRQLGKNNLIGKVVEVRTMKERDKTKELEEEIHRLRKALSDTQIKCLAMESLVEVASEHYGEDLKKNFGSKELRELKREPKKKRSKE
jgi:transposase-like protein